MLAYRDKNKSTWIIKFNNTTKQGFHSKKEALFFEAKLKHIDEPKVTNKTLKEVGYDFLAYKKIKVCYGSYDKSRNSIERHTRPNFKSDKQITKITDLDCRQYYEILGQFNYSTIYRNSVLQTFKAIFKHIEKFFNLKLDPTHFIERYK